MTAQPHDGAVGDARKRTQSEDVGDVESLRDEIAMHVTAFAAGRIDGAQAIDGLRAMVARDRAAQRAAALREAADEIPCRHLELPDTLWKRLRAAEEQAARRLELLGAVVSYDAANQSDLPLALLTSLRAEVRAPR